MFVSQESTLSILSPSLLSSLKSILYIYDEDFSILILGVVHIHKNFQPTLHVCFTKREGKVML